MSTERALPSDSPVMNAWNEYKATDEFANSKRWATHLQHVDGSLWASFLQGWTAATLTSPTPSVSLTSGGVALFEEHRERLELMGEGNPKWDLSPNDRAAINQAVSVIDHLTERLSTDADRVKELEAENARIRSYLTDGAYEALESEMAWKRRAESAEAQVKELTEALKPFANFPRSGAHAGAKYNADPVYAFEGYELTVGDFRRARDVLASHPGGEA